MSKYGHEHIPMANFVMQFDDKTGAQRTTLDFDCFVDELREVAGRYGFDINAWSDDARKIADVFNPELRDRFAGQALIETIRGREDNPETAAEYAYKAADAMLEARKR